MSNLYILYVFIFFTFLLNVANFSLTYKKLTRSENLLYIYLLVSVLGWFVSNAGADLIKEPSLAIFFARLALIFPLNILNALFQITQIFPQSFLKTFQKATFRVAGIFVVWATAMSILFFDTSMNISNFTITLDGPIDYTPGELYFLMVLGVTVFLILICVSWFRNLANYTKIQRRQVGIFLGFLGFTYLSILFGSIILPLQGFSQYAPTMFLSLSLFLFVTNQNLLVKGFMPNVFYDLGVLIWGILCSGIATLFIFTVTQYQGSLTFFSIFLLTLMLLAIFLWSYKKVVAWLRRGYLGVEDEVLKFASRTTVILDREKIVEELYYTLGIIFPKTNCKVVLEIQNNSQLFKQLKKWWSSFQNPLILTQETFVEQFLLGKADEELTKDLYSTFREKNIELAIPLNIGERLGGMVVMKNLTRVLGVKEHEILSLLSENASLAISRSILHEEVEEYSRSLESKVSEQTKEIRSKMESMEEMRQRERDLLDIMGHELRTPLTIARNSLELVDIYKRNQKKKSKVIKWDSNFQKQFDYIKAAVRREMGIVETLLSATKLDAKKLDTHITEVDLIKVIDTALLGFEKEALRKNLELKIDMNKNKRWVVSADSLQIQQVVDNILSNAVKYTHKGYIKISLKDLDNEISVVISDTGEGMSKENINRLGTKFFRLNQYLPSNGDGAEKGLVRPGGTGLGLYVAFGLVKLMQGKYEVKSELSKGSTFTLIFQKP